MAGSGPDEMQIGRVLSEARERAGLELREVEERTKIRSKYLRALEEEQWQVLPSPAYARGFLRTYAQLLGLDGEALADEFRRQVEGEQEPAYPVADQVLRRGRRRGEPPRRPPTWLIAALVALVGLGVLLAIGAFDGEDGETDRRGDRQREAREQREERRRQERRRDRREARREQAGPQKVTMRLEIEDAVSVCLLGDAGRPLIDGQVLAAGSEEGPYEAERFQLRFPYGYDREQFALFLNGERERVRETSGPTAFSIRPPAKMRLAETPPESCP